MSEIVLRIETETGQITKTQIVAGNAEEERHALGRLQLFLLEIHKLRKALLKIVFLESRLKPSGAE